MERKWIQLYDSSIQYSGIKLFNSLPTDVGILITSEYLLINVKISYRAMLIIQLMNLLIDL